MFYVIFHADNFDIRLIHQHRRYMVYICYKWADHAHSGDIVNISHHTADRKGQSLFLHFLDNTIRRFYTAFNILDWIPVIAILKFFIQYFQFCGYLLYARLIKKHDLAVLFFHI